MGSTVQFVTAAAMGAISAGLMVITATVLGVDALRAEAGSNNLSLPFYLLVGGTLLGILLAAFAAWWLLGPIVSTYRRGGLAMVCAFATVVLMLICIPVNQLWGRGGLGGLLAIWLVSAMVLTRRARRLGAGA